MNLTSEFPISIAPASDPAPITLMPNDQQVAKEVDAAPANRAGPKQGHPKKKTQEGGATGTVARRSTRNQRG